MIKTFSRKQRRVLSWWHRKSRDFDRDAIICDGSVRSGKTFCILFHFHQEAFWFLFTFCHKGGVICISEVIDISPGNQFQLVLLPAQRFS